MVVNRKSSGVNGADPGKIVFNVVEPEKKRR